MNDLATEPSAPGMLGRLALPEPIQWLLGEGRRIDDGGVFFGELCQRLVAAGLPLWRANLSVRVLHPQLNAVYYRWWRGGEVERLESEHGSEHSDAYLSSPIRVIYEGAAGLRRRLDRPDPHLDFPILAELKAAGATDYVAMALPDSADRPAAVSWTSDRAGGFATDDLTLLNDMLPILSLVVEVHKLRRIGASLLDVYLGAETGRRVLEGAVQRGQLETIHAVLWYCDLRGFTHLSDTLPHDELITLLNEYFEAVGEPVIARGGEILKFIGDAMLAIFPLDLELDRSATQPALAAAGDALANVRELNARRAANGQRSIKLGIALHIGDVGYGNIGAPTRLDFTVIGSAVNKVVRIEALSKALDRPLLLSADFARRYGQPLLSLGFHALRGISEPEEVFCCPVTEANA
ncbi:MAG TPA: adenylate/guanylate cyclase domain-containing protein [Alphaproteobacteria bacterium]|nr:adenylate/guanylate cyclase domain-containing protein [Alphaproteobacteria bacterium]